MPLNPFNFFLPNLRCLCVFFPRNTKGTNQQERFYVCPESKAARTDALAVCKGLETDQRDKPSAAAGLRKTPKELFQDIAD